MKDQMDNYAFKFFSSQILSGANANVVSGRDPYVYIEEKKITVFTKILGVF